MMKMGVRRPRKGIPSKKVAGKVGPTTEQMELKSEKETSLLANAAADTAVSPDDSSGIPLSADSKGCSTPERSSPSDGDPYSSPVSLRSAQNRYSSKKRTPRTLMKMMQRHRDNERFRHQSLNNSIQKLSERIPGYSEATKETKVVMLQRVVNYICHLEGYILQLCDEMDLAMDFQGLFLSPQLDPNSETRQIFSPNFNPEDETHSSSESPEYMVPSSTYKPKPRRKVSSPTVDSTTKTPEEPPTSDLPTPPQLAPCLEQDEDEASSAAKVLEQELANLPEELLEEIFRELEACDKKDASGEDGDGFEWLLDPENVELLSPLVSPQKFTTLPIKSEKEEMHEPDEGLNTPNKLLSGVKLEPEESQSVPEVSESAAAEVYLQFPTQFDDSLTNEDQAQNENDLSQDVPFTSYRGSFQGEFLNKLRAENVMLPDDISKDIMASKWTIKDENDSYKDQVIGNFSHEDSENPLKEYLVRETENPVFNFVKTNSTPEYKSLKTEYLIGEESAQEWECHLLPSSTESYNDFVKGLSPEKVEFAVPEVPHRDYVISVRTDSSLPAGVAIPVSGVVSKSDSWREPRPQIQESRHDYIPHSTPVTISTSSHPTPFTASKALESVDMSTSFGDNSYGSGCAPLDLDGASEALDLRIKKEPQISRCKTLSLSESSFPGTPVKLPSSLPGTLTSLFGTPKTPRTPVKRKDSLSEEAACSSGSKASKCRKEMSNSDAVVPSSLLQKMQRKFSHMSASPARKSNMYHHHNKNSSARKLLFSDAEGSRGSEHAESDKAISEDDDFRLINYEEENDVFEVEAPSGNCKEEPAGLYLAEDSQVDSGFFQTNSAERY